MIRTIRAALACLIPLTLITPDTAHAWSCEPFTVAVFPDTQNFSKDSPEIYEAMTSWVVANREARNIVFASHVGDIVNDDTLSQWANARAAHDILSAAGVPFGTAVGNHDFGLTNQPATGADSYLDNFGPDAPYNSQIPAQGSFRDQPWYGGASPTGLSSYQLIDAGPVPLLFLNIEVDLRLSEVEWAKDVVAQHPGRVVIVSAHRYIYDFRLLRGRFSPFVYDNVDPLYSEDSIGAQGLYDELVNAFPNVLMVWCGHVDGEYRRTGENGQGLPVHELLQDFQSFSPFGGNGWLRLYEFDPAAGEIRVETFSPTALDQSGMPGRLRTLDDQVAEGELALNAYGQQVFDLLAPLLANLDPGLITFLQLLFANEGAASMLIDALAAGQPEVIELLADAFGIPVDEFAATVASVPWDDLNPGVVELLDTEGDVLVGLILNQDLPGLIDYFTANDGTNIAIGLYGDGQADPNFTIEGVDLRRYIANPSRCNDADFAEPYGVYDLADIAGFVTAFLAEDLLADIAEPRCVFDLTDVTAFASIYRGGCP